jgi:hypothetical protein
VGDIQYVQQVEVVGNVTDSLPVLELYIWNQQWLGV